MHLIRILGTGMWHFDWENSALKKKHTHHHRHRCRLHRRQNPSLVFSIQKINNHFVKKHNFTEVKASRVEAK